MAEKKKTRGGTEDGERHRKGAEDGELGGFGIPLLFCVEPRTPRAHETADMQINSRVSAEALSRARGYDCWLGAEVNMAGATPTCGTTEGGHSSLPHVSFRQKNYVWHQSPFQHFPFLFFGGFGGDVEETGPLA